jgi:hypothetical protein
MFTQSAYVSFKKSSQLFRKYLQNSATKHLICRTQDLNFFQLKNLGGFRELLAMSHCQKRGQKNALLARGLQHDVQISRFIF